MPKQVLDIGNCGLDHGTITTMVESHFDAVVDQADAFDDALERLQENEYDLVLVNRLLDRDGSSGMEVIQRIKKHHKTLNVMLITNFPEHQDAAVEAGAVRGFGKNSVNDPDTAKTLRQYLPPRPPASE